MNKFNFQQTGGFPIDTNIFNDIEEAYSLFNVFGALAGDKTIISGCVEIGNNVSDGYVYVNGELFKFLGGQKGSTIVLIEESTAAIFEDGQTKTILKKRYYQFGSGVGALTWESFKRFDALTSLTNRVLKLETPIHGQIEIVQSDLKQYGSNPGGLVQHQFRKKIPGNYAKSSRLFYSLSTVSNTFFSPPNAFDPLSHHVLEDTTSLLNKDFYVQGAGVFDFVRWRFFINYYIL